MHLLLIILLFLLGWLLVGFLSAYLCFLVDDEDYTLDVVAFLTLLGPIALLALIFAEGSPLRRKADDIVIFKKKPHDIPVDSAPHCGYYREG